MIEKENYTIVTPITIASLVKAAKPAPNGTLDRVVIDFAWNICGVLEWGRHRHIPLEVALDFASHYEGGVEWLKEKGFIKKKEDPTYSVGDVVLVKSRHHEVYCLIAAISWSKVSLVDFVRPNMYFGSGPFTPEDNKRILRSEIPLSKDWKIDILGGHLEHVSK